MVKPRLYLDASVLSAYSDDPWAKRLPDFEGVISETPPPAPLSLAYVIRARRARTGVRQVRRAFSVIENRAEGRAHLLHGAGVSSHPGKGGAMQISTGVRSGEGPVLIPGG